MEKKLAFNQILSEGMQIGLKNIASVLGAVVLWILTIWIPYLNVGTTIALFTMPIELAKGNIISPTYIFDPKYRRYMGEFFLLQGFVQIGVAIGAIFMFVPGIVISIAWSLAVYLLLDKGMNPTQAITESNNITNGHKWTIFLGKLVLVLIPYVVVIIGVMLIKGIIGNILGLIGMIGCVSFALSADAVIYKYLVIGDSQENSSVQ